MSPLLEVQNLTKHYTVRKGWFGQAHTLPIVNNVSFDIEHGEVVGLVGESGSGKSTIGRCLLKLIEPTSGGVRFNGRWLDRLSHREMRPLRRHMQIIFQDPYASLNPRKRALDLIGEGFDIQGIVHRSERRERIMSLLEAVGLNADAAQRYPHEFSGGQRQRIGIARAIALEPEFIVADEPVSALDVTIRAQVLELLASLRKRMALSMLFISHDLNVIEHNCDRVIVLYLGRIMEIAPTRTMFLKPLHPYTEALLSASPARVGERKSRRVILMGELPSQANPPSGCVFRTRCRYATAECAQEVPPLQHIGSGRYTACIHHAKLN